MIMSGVYSNFVLFACLLACVSGKELVRNKRQWPYSYDTNDRPYGACGKPTMPIPHGGIKLFPINDIDNPHDNSCYSCTSIGCPSCEPKFYCKDGYENRGFFRLDCVQDRITRQYKWEGSIPTCEEKTTNMFVYVTPVIIIASVLLLTVISATARNNRRKNRTTRITASSSGLRSTTIYVTPSSRATGGRTLDIPRVPFRGPGYSRFDDSDVNVPQDETISSRYDTEVPAVEAVSSDAPPSYTQALEIERADPASTSMNPATTVDTPAAIIATT